MTRPFASRLVAWHATHGRQDLPWQGTRDAYRVWLSEIMLQQTQVATVVPYYWRFLAEFPDVGALAAAPLERVLEHWSGLGYYRRAHHLHAAARVIVAEHGGSFPRDVEALAALPGIGRSTAAAIAAFSFSVRAAILDGNVKRVLARHRGIEGFPGSARVETALWRVAESLLPANDIETYTQALMDLGATVCTRTRPQCEHCPVAGDCIARRDGRTDALPSPRPARRLPQRALRVLLLEHAGNLLLEKRAPVGIWAGLWSLPEMALDDDVAAHCRARFGAQVTVGDALPTIEHGFTHFRLTLHPQRVAVRRWPARAEAPGYAWLLPGDALAAALPAPIRKLLRSIAVPARPSRQPRARTR
ncbi:MAG: A/G-specific adenine glycosylase [Betaproteobacteria bacterium]|nr:A/G-specific adenine glycosylase [Betaproteobacteria bacterium]